MTRLRQGPPGKTRNCPHCRTSILDSARICPACRHHLRFDSPDPAQADVQLKPFQVDGTIRHPRSGESWEYCVVVTIRDERGEEIARKVVGVGALNPAEERTISLAVEVHAPPGTELSDIEGPKR